MKAKLQETLHFFIFYVSDTKRLGISCVKPYFLQIIHMKYLIFSEKLKKKEKQDVFVKHEHVPRPRSIFL